MIPVIDFHAHIFPDDLAPRVIEKLVVFAPTGRNFTDGTAGDLQRSMRQNGVEQSVILPIATKLEQVATINTAQAALNRQAFIPFGSLHPDTTAIDETIVFFQKNDIRGIKLHPEFQDFYIDDPRYFPLYEALSDAGIIVVFHAGKDPGPFSCDHALPKAFITLRSNFPNLKMVAAHMGGWQIWEQSFDKLCGLPLFFDTSAVYGLINRQLFIRMIQKHGVEWILFGSDSPWFDLGSACRWIEELPLKDDDKERIFRLNAVDLLAF